jgi:hypothetical protein
MRLTRSKKFLEKAFESFARITEQRIHRKKAARDISDMCGETKQHRGPERKRGKAQDILRSTYYAMARLFSVYLWMKFSKWLKSGKLSTSWLKVNVSLTLWGLNENIIDDIKIVKSFLIEKVSGITKSDRKIKT